MTNRFNQYNDVVLRILRETIACTPQEWTKGALTIDCDGVRINYKLKNDEQPNPASISQSLRTLIEELYVTMANQGDQWTQATLSFFQEGDDWKYNVKFDYASDVPTSEESVAPSNAKRTWKFWQ